MLALASRGLLGWVMARLEAVPLPSLGLVVAFGTPAPLDMYYGAAVCADDLMHITDRDEGHVHALILASLLSLNGFQTAALPTAAHVRVSRHYAGVRVHGAPVISPQRWTPQAAQSNSRVSRDRSRKSRTHAR